ncbi:MAG: hypothetical protein H0W70_00165 [Actinobacteria bacterium]|nr:hypothetical protein [Actinomycetota bacterium]
MIAVAALAACGHARADPANSGPYGAAYAGICNAISAAKADNAGRARTIFFNVSHQRIHELAAATEPVERGIAARLLEAKQRVEAEFLAAKPNTTLRADLVRLGVAMAKAMTVTAHVHPPTCPN